MNTIDPTNASHAGFPRKPVLFCDFDGTITLTDNVISLMQHFNPQGWESIAGDIVSGRKTLQTGVGEMFDLFPASMKDEVTNYILSSASIREGFPELLQWCKEHDVPFYVTSGGIDFFIEPLLEPFGIPADHIYCNGSDFSGDRIRVTWPHECDDDCDNGGCGMCKTTVIRRFPRDEYYRILIGDSITDFEGAKLVDLVFSRSHLTDRCRELGYPHIPFETFHDVIRHLDAGTLLT